MKNVLVSGLRVSTACAVIAAGVCFCSGSALGQDVVVRYRITVIDPLPASRICDCFVATGISPNGIVTGVYNGPDNAPRSFIWQNEVTRDIGGADGVEHAALAVNDDGVTVGFGGFFAFRAQGGLITNLATLGGQDSKASDINNAGVIVGSASNRDGSRAAMWTGDSVVDLGTLGGELSEALGVNQTGQVVGWAWNQRHDKLAFVWSAEAGMQALPLPATDAILAEAVSINDRGDAVGTADVLRERSPGEFQQQFRGYVWSADGSVQDLGDITPAMPFAISIMPTAINDSRQVVGNVSIVPDVTVPFLWENGQMRDLNTLVDPAAGWQVFSAKDINNRGQIAASGINTDGRRRALLLTPICAGDFNNSGTVSVEDVFAFLTAYFGQDPRADFDRSGGISVQDVFSFLTAYFDGCH